jgi:hypothetical protein
VAIVWRKKDGSNTWHFCSNCQHWPTSNYETSDDKPTSGEPCHECRAKQDTDNCA